MNVDGPSAAVNGIVADPSCGSATRWSCQVATNAPSSGCGSWTSRTYGVCSGLSSATVGKMISTGSVVSSAVAGAASATVSRQARQSAR
jgi:hypothetical protein